MITVTQVKSELDTESTKYDDLIEWLIDSVEAIWESRTNKYWVERTVKEQLDEVPGKMVFLRGVNISRIYSVSTGLDSALVISQADENVLPTVSVTDTSLVLVTHDSEIVLLFADYPTLSDLAAGIAGQAGWGASVYPGHVNTLSKTLIETAGQFCETTGTAFYAPDAYVKHLKFDAKLSSLTFEAIITPIIAKYKCGYTDLNTPAWLAQILIRQVCHWYHQAIEGRWHVTSMALADGGTISYGGQEGNMLSDFVDATKRNGRVPV